MKATLQVLLLLLGASGALAAFVGLIGLDTSLAFLTSQTAIAFYPVAGLLLIGFSDYTRRPVIALAPAPKATPVPGTSRPNAYGIRRHTCPVA